MKITEYLLLLTALLLSWAAPYAQAPATPYAAPDARAVLAGTAPLRVLLVSGQAMLAWKGDSEVRVRAQDNQAPLAGAAAGETIGIARKTADGSAALRKANANVAPVTAPIVLTSATPINVWTATPDRWTRYAGPLIVTPTADGAFSLSQEVPLEEYLRSVVPAEMPSSFHPQALRAQAILARTYTLQWLGRHAAEGADLCAGVHCQVFGADARRTAATDAAVRDTAGVILLYRGATADVFYHSCCGGVTDDAGMVWGPEYARPYLTGVADTSGALAFPLADAGAVLARHDQYCTAGTQRWTKTFSAAEASALARKNLSKVTGDPLTTIATVTNLAVESRTPSGRAATLRVEGDGASVLVFGDAIRWLFGNGQPGPEGLWSTLFDLTVTRDPGGRVTAYTFTGSGRGHGLGLCQWGAQGRAKAGQSYREILRAYFPQTELSKK